MNKYYELTDGTRVWLDGDIEYSTKRAVSAILEGKQVKFLIDPEERKLAKLAEKTQLDVERIKNGKEFNFEQTITEQICIDIVLKDFKQYLKTHKLNKEETYKRVQRLKYEWDLFKQYKCYHLIYVLKYVVNMFEKNQICWGVGRGSSVSVYTFHVIGVHDIDSVKYDLDPTEFFHEE